MIFKYVAYCLIGMATRFAAAMLAIGTMLALPGVSAEDPALVDCLSDPDRLGCATNEGPDGAAATLHATVDSLCYVRESGDGGTPCPLGVPPCLEEDPIDPSNCVRHGEPQTIHIGPPCNPATDVDCYVFDIILPLACPGQDCTYHVRVIMKLVGDVDPQDVVDWIVALFQEVEAEAKAWGNGVEGIADRVQDGDLSDIDALYDILLEGACAGAEQTIGSTPGC